MTGVTAGQHATALPNPVHHQPQPQAANVRADALTERVLIFLSHLLPTFTGDGNFNLCPPLDICTMIMSSVILEKVAQLIRNDSLEDATRRYGLYESVLDFVQALGSHHTTAEAAVHLERDVKPEGVDLLKISFGTTPVSKGKDKDKDKDKDENKVEKSQSIASCLRNLNTQSNMMLQMAKNNEEDFRGQDSQQMLKLCQRIADLADFLLANSHPDEAGKVDAESTTAWERWQKEFCLLELPDAEILSGHHFAQEAAKMRNPPIGRMKHLLLEMTNLKTGLPAGIFVRYASSRLDLLKALIVGPAGSPYAGGLFEFDVVLPMAYPNVPPKMHFRTTGGGTVRFNPNLYNNGYGELCFGSRYRRRHGPPGAGLLIRCCVVCLSLLGTWSGENWKPGKSTLLQVFLSIQAMIFCEHPWTNEPSREDQAHLQVSKDYNKGIRTLTVRHAMLYWLQSNDDNIWSDVVLGHFKNNATQILNQVREWAKDKPPAGRHHYLVPAGPISPQELSQLEAQLSKFMLAQTVA